jgi:2-haloacid dehalogenase
MLGRNWSGGMIAGIKALTFDTGGTVLDWHRGISAAMARAGARRGLTADWARLTNDYRRRSLQAMVGQVKPDFNIDDVHRRILAAVIDENGLQAFTEEDREAIWRTWHELDAWPDFPAALVRLRRKFPVVSFTILSTALILDVSRRNRLDWDCVVACEMIGTYKTRPEAYTTCAKWLGFRPDQLLMVACHNFDLDAARAVGYRTAFVRRPEEWGAAGPPDPTPNPANDIVVDGFAELADRLGC